MPRRAWGFEGKQEPGVSSVCPVMDPGIKSAITQRVICNYTMRLEEDITHALRE